MEWVSSGVLSRALECCGPRPQDVEDSAFLSWVSMLEGNSMERWNGRSLQLALEDWPTHAWEGQGQQRRLVWEVTHPETKLRFRLRERLPKKIPQKQETLSHPEGGGGFGRWDKASWRGAGEASRGERHWVCWGEKHNWQAGNEESVDVAERGEEEGYVSAPTIKARASLLWGQRGEDQTIKQLQSVDLVSWADIQMNETGDFQDPSWFRILSKRN